MADLMSVTARSMVHSFCPKQVAATQDAHGAGRARGTRGRRRLCLRRWETAVQVFVAGKMARRRDATGQTGYSAADTTTVVATARSGGGSARAVKGRRGVRGRVRCAATRQGWASPRANPSWRRGRAVLSLSALLQRSGRVGKLGELRELASSSMKLTSRLFVRTFGSWSSRWPVRPAPQYE